MRIPRCAIVVLIVSTVVVAGCGGGGNEVETMEFKPTDTTQFKGMLDQQAKGLKGAKTGEPLKGAKTEEPLPK